MNPNGLKKYLKVLILIVWCILEIEKEIDSLKSEKIKDQVSFFSPE